MSKSCAQTGKLPDGTPLPKPEDLPPKLDGVVRAVRGAIWDVAVDIRPGSPAFGRWVACEVSAENRRQLWVPAGLAHGFLVLSESAEVLYKTTDYYSPPGERCIVWNDPELAIEWPLESEPVVSDKDQQGVSFAEAVPRIQA